MVGIVFQRQQHSDDKKDAATAAAAMDGECEIAGGDMNIRRKSLFLASSLELLEPSTAFTVQNNNNEIGGGGSSSSRGGDNVNDDDSNENDDYLKRLRQATAATTSKTTTATNSNRTSDPISAGGTSTVVNSSEEFNSSRSGLCVPEVSSSTERNDFSGSRLSDNQGQVGGSYMYSKQSHRSTITGSGSGSGGYPSGSTTLPTIPQHGFSRSKRQSGQVQLMSSREVLISEKHMTISQDRLRFDRIRLRGRGSERKVLIEAFDACYKSNDADVYDDRHEGEVDNNNDKNKESRSRQVVFIRGTSGSGKTSLANSITKHVKRNGGLLVRGKCDIYQREEPFATISNAVREICGTLLYLDSFVTSPSIATANDSKDPTTNDQSEGSGSNNNKSTTGKGNNEDGPLTTFQEFEKEVIERIDVSDIKLLIKICPELGEIIDVASLRNATLPSPSSSGENIIDEAITDLEENMLELDRLVSKDDSGGGSGSDRRLSSTTSGLKAGTANASSNDDGTLAKMRLQHSFRILFRIITKHLGPIVIVFDDIQWTDEASASMIQSLLLDIENSRLLLIGIYRSDEVDETHLIAKLKNELLSKGGDYQFEVSEIAIKELTLADTNHILMELMSIDDEETTMPLAKICYKRTLGNPSFLLAFMKKLWETKLISFSFGLYRWKWNLDDILSETHAMTNVVDLMKGSLEALPKSVQRRLSIAAYLGTRLQPAVLNVVLQGLTDTLSGESGEKEGTQTSSISLVDDVVDDESSEDWLLEAEKMGLIEPIESSKVVISYQWIHDNVQEAAMSLIPPNELPTLKKQIATILLGKLDMDQNSNMIFVIANLLNEGSEDANTKLQRAEINLKAAQHASRYSAFDTSVKYAIQGIELLPKDRWEKHFDLSFDLYCTAVENGLPVGMNTQVQGLFEEVVAQDKCSLVDKMRVYIPKIVFLAGNLPNGGQGEQGPIALIVSLLKQLGHRFPKGKFGQIVSVLRGSTSLRKRLKKMSTDDVLKLPKMESEVDQAKMMLLLRLTIASYTSTEKIYLPLAICAMLRLTLEKGLSLYAPVAFACYSVIAIAVLDDFTISYKAGQMSEKLTNARVKPLESRSPLYVNAFSRAWVDPVFSLDAGLLKTYRLGMSLGEVDSAMVAIYLTVSVGLQTGKSLRLLESDCRIFAAQMKEFKRTSILCFTITYWLAIVQLMGCQDSIPPLQGVDASMSFDDWLSVHKDDNTISAKVKSLMSFLFMIMGEYQKGAELAIEKGDSYGRTSPGHSWFMLDTFARAISLYAMAKQSKARKYATQGRRLHKKIKVWTKRGVPSVGHYEKILNAEWFVIKGDFDEAERWYQSAVTLCSKSGFTGDAALAMERFGLFFLKERNDKAEATYRLEESCKLYQEWGAKGKAQSIRKEYSYLWPQPNEIILTEGTSQDQNISALYRVSDQGVVERC